jgi:hypothetical protein
LCLEDGNDSDPEQRKSLGGTSLSEVKKIVRGRDMEVHSA